MSSAYKELKLEIDHLKNVFTKSHEVIRIVSATVDDLTCACDINEKRHSVSCNITALYPDVAPMWFSESEDPNVLGIIERMSYITADKHLLLNMMKFLAVEIYKLKNLPTPPEITNMKVANTLGETSVTSDEDDDDMEFDEEYEDVDEAEEQDDFDIESHLTFNDDLSNEEVEEKQAVGDDKFKVLQDLRLSQRQEHINGTVSGSVQATDRLMKELLNIYKSESYKTSAYTIELKDDTNLYEWFVKLKLRGFDKESHLHKDIEQLYKKDFKTDHICLSITFTDKFPMTPPFIRVCYPVLAGGYVLTGGALCMELLTPQGWSSAYSIEAVIMQLSATLVKGKARVDFPGTSKVGCMYSWAKAQASYKNLVHMHEKRGWFTPPKDEG
jgi:ubiquitin-conjugating enzyme E2 Q